MGRVVQEDMVVLFMGTTTALATAQGGVHGGLCRYCGGWRINV